MSNHVPAIESPAVPQDEGPDANYKAKAEVLNHAIQTIGMGHSTDQQPDVLRECQQRCFRGMELIRDCRENQRGIPMAAFRGDRIRLGERQLVADRYLSDSPCSLE
jgi:hypothetical protein